jgi:hypothetical protein
MEVFFFLSGCEEREAMMSKSSAGRRSLQITFVKRREGKRSEYHV